MERWDTVAHIGYQGKRKDAQIAKWNDQFGEGNWRLIWQTTEGKTLDYEDVFWRVYVAGYTRHFLRQPAEEILNFAASYAYTYDKDLITYEQAFDPYFLYNKPGKPNQFHHVALNIAMEWFTGRRFSGINPIQVREGKPGTPISEWPAGWRWSPGRIPATRPDLIIPIQQEGWWQKGSIEDFYQSNKVLQVINYHRPGKWVGI